MSASLGQNTGDSGRRSHPKALPEVPDDKGRIEAKFNFGTDYTGSLMREVGYNQWGKKQSFFTHCLTPTPADAPHRPPPSEAPMSKHTERANCKEKSSADLSASGGLRRFIGLENKRRRQ